MPKRIDIAITKEEEQEKSTKQVQKSIINNKAKEINVKDFSTIEKNNDKEEKDKNDLETKIKSIEDKK